jgi:hypothetical protein
MANEIAHNYTTGSTLYACRFQLDGDVFLTAGASDEVWGTGGRDADDYDVAMTESGSSGHYVCDFDASSNIAEGHYRVTVFLQAGANPADADIELAQGEIFWDGTSEVTMNTAMSDLPAGAPSATARWITALNYLYEYWRNKVITNSSTNEIEVYKDDGSTKLCEADISDDGSLFTKGEFGAAD